MNHKILSRANLINNGPTRATAHVVQALMARNGFLGALDASNIGMPPAQTSKEQTRYSMIPLTVQHLIQSFKTGYVPGASTPAFLDLHHQHQPKWIKP